MKKLALSLAILLTPLFAVAHGVGSSLEATVNGYLIDIGYSALEAEAGVPVRFDFDLKEDNGLKPTDFSTVFFRIESGEGPVIFAGNISRAEFGETGATVTFPHDGSYTVSARFYDGEREIVSADFSLPVAASGERPAKTPASWMAAAALALGLAGGFFAGRKNF